MELQVTKKEDKKPSISTFKNEAKDFLVAAPQKVHTPNAGVRKTQQKKICLTNEELKELQLYIDRGLIISADIDTTDKEKVALLIKIAEGLESSENLLPDDLDI